MITSTDSVVLCVACEGTGSIRYLADTRGKSVHMCSIHEMPVIFTEQFETCESCKGTGRLTKITTIEYKPYERKES